ATTALALSTATALTAAATALSTAAAALLALLFRSLRISGDGQRQRHNEYCYDYESMFVRTDSHDRTLPFSKLIMACCPGTGSKDFPRQLSIPMSNRWSTVWYTRRDHQW